MLCGKVGEHALHEGAIRKIQTIYMCFYVENWRKLLTFPLPNSYNVVKNYLRVYMGSFYTSDFSILSILSIVTRIGLSYFTRTQTRTLNLVILTHAYVWLSARSACYRNNAMVYWVHYLEILSHFIRLLFLSYLSDWLQILDFASSKSDVSFPRWFFKIGQQKVN